MNLKFLLSSKKSHDLFITLFSRSFSFSLPSLSLSRFTNENERRRRETPALLIAISRQGPDIQVYRINRIPRELFSCLVDSQQPTTSRAIFYHRIREFGSVKMSRRNNYSNQGARLLSRFLFLSRNLWDRPSTSDSHRAIFVSFFFPFFL